MSADTRYKLLVNGHRVSVGPTRGSDKVWYYDTVDLAPWLILGKNEIVIKVVRFFPTAIAGFAFARTALPGLAVIGNIGSEDISTGPQDERWEGRVERHVSFPTSSETDIFLHVSL